MRSDIDYRKPENRHAGFDAFYEFQCATNDCSPDIAVEKWIANDMNFDFEKRCVMALFHGATYAGPCESIFADKFPVMTPAIIPSMVEFFNTNKKRLLFSPDAKYRKMVFPKFLESIGESLGTGTLGDHVKSCLTSEDPKVNYITLQNKCMNDWFHWGRMGHWSFAEALQRFTNAPIEAPTMEFGNSGKSHTSGWAFSINRDDLVGDQWNKEEVNFLESTAANFIKAFKAEKPTLRNVNFFTLETACCNYKRQHKGSRYGGCYIDEQYTETMQMKKDWPEYNWLWDKYFEGRQQVIPASLLYENFKHLSQNDASDAYIKSWTGALRDYGRIPRVEAWQNDQPQIWTELHNMPFAKSGSSLLELMG